MARLRLVRVGHARQVEVKTGAQTSTYRRTFRIMPPLPHVCVLAQYVALPNTPDLLRQPSYGHCLLKIQADLGASACIKVI
jgi:hypothetical protein